MKLTFLGTGTSHGVPMIACDCEVCTSSDPHNKRTRTSALVEVDNISLLIDTGPELRLQAVREGITHIDAVLFTHAHADHIFGLDDVRRFNEISRQPMPCYGSGETLRTIRRAFEYVFVPTQIGGGKPSLELFPIFGPFEVKGVRVTPVPVLHGRMNVLGVRIGDMAYITDCSEIPHQSMKMLRGLDTLVLGAIRFDPPHSTHFTVNQAIEAARELKPKRTFITHITHRLDHESTNKILPADVQLAYDGLQITL